MAEYRSLIFVTALLLAAFFVFEFIRLLVGEVPINWRCAFRDVRRISGPSKH
jgi:hypothetical protein